jgi:hypothetical protein
VHGLKRFNHVASITVAASLALTAVARDGGDDGEETRSVAR